MMNISIDRLGLKGRRFCFFVLLLTVLFASVNASAGEISVLAPFGNETVVLSRNKTISVVVRIEDVNDLDQLFLLSDTGEQVFDPSGRFEKDGVYFVHYKLPLRKGNNRFVLMPVRYQFKIKYKPLSSLANVDLANPGIYRLHRQESIPASCQPCHAKEIPAGVKVGWGAYGASSTECYSCHQNMVEGSQWRHSPSAALQCRFCHGDDAGQTRVAIPAGRVEKLCFGCHINQNEWLAMAHVHGPVGTGDCTICHDPHGSDNQFQLWAEGKAKICVICHEDKKKYVNSTNNKFVVHGILEAKGCVVCHNPHASEYRFQLYAEINDLCLSCHQSIQGLKSGHPVRNHPVSGKKDPNRPGRAMTCTSCHNPHGSPFSEMLIGDRRGGELCRNCHDNGGQGKRGGF